MSRKQGPHLVGMRPPVIATSHRQLGVSPPSLAMEVAA